MMHANEKRGNFYHNKLGDYPEKGPSMSIILERKTENCCYPYSNDEGVTMAIPTVPQASTF